MPVYICSNGKRIKEISSKHLLQPGDIMRGKRGAIFNVINQKGGVPCTDGKSVKIAPSEYVRNALLLARYRLGSQQQ